MTQTAVEKRDKATLATRPAAPIEVRKGEIQPRNLPEMIELAKILAHSGLVPQAFQGKVGDVMVAIQMGAEVGLSPMASLRGIAVINGRPSLWGDALIGIVRARPDCEDVQESFDEKTMTATCVVKRRGASPVVQTFSKEDAVTAKLWTKAGPWTNYPKRMLQMRARGFALRDAFADALGGISMAEESQDSPPVYAAPPPLDSSDFELLAEAAPPEDSPAANGAPPDPDPAPPEPRPELMKLSDRREFAKALKAKGAAELAVALFGASEGWTVDIAPVLRKLLASTEEIGQAYGPPDGWAEHVDEIRGML